MAWGRVALLLAATETHKQHLDDLAQVLAYVRQPEEALLKQERPIGTDSTEIPEVEARKTVIADRPKMIFWQITKITSLQAVDNSPAPYLQDRQKAASYNVDKKGTYLFESPKPLATLTQLSPLLINSLGRKVTGRQLDYRKTIRRISRGKSISKLSYYAHSKWPLKITILIDKHSELYPYWLDFDKIAQQLQSQLGQSQVQVIELHERNLHEFVAKQYSIASSVLILSDLNHYANSHRYWAWQEIIQSVKKQATEILILSPATQTDGQAKEYKQLNITSLQPSQGFIRQIKKQPYQNPVSPAQIEQALTMISPLALADSGLIRKLRLNFHWGNAALEGEIWNDKRIVQSYIGIRLQDQERQKYHQQFSALAPAIKKAYWELVNTHQQQAYQGLSFLNAISEAGLAKQDEVKDSHALVEKIQALLAYSYQMTSETAKQKINQQLATLVYFVPQQAWESDELSSLLHYNYAVAYQEEIKKGQWPEELPAGCQIDQLPLLDESLAQELTQNFQFKRQGLAGAAVFDSIDNEQDIHYCRLSAVNNRPAVWQYTDQKQENPLKTGDEVELLENQSLIIKTLAKQWQVKAITCPDFAENIGQDSQGLFIETQLNQADKRYDWLPEEQDTSGQTLAGIWFPQQVDLSTVTRDALGVYMDVHIEKISQRFRYIPPGKFLMGSPKDEAEREVWGKETQHSVTLSDGFWLADTTVTQALYQQVMGNNPSYFTTDLNLPVEEVSWNDAQQFIEKLNQLIPTFKAQLPTEAQWEYACRAGTKTPFSFGNNITPEQVNYNGDHPYLEAKEGLAREKTVVVKSLSENQWGLYEMHGNVWEWCDDVYQNDLGAKAVVDPKGKESGVDRVLRGGSWSSNGRNVRSAIRGGRRPVLRNRSIGFRLSLGLELQPGKEQVDSQQSHSRRDVAKEADGGQDAVNLSSKSKHFLKGK